MSNTRALVYCLNVNTTEGCRLETSVTVDVYAFQCFSVCLYFLYLQCVFMLHIPCQIGEFVFFLISLHLLINVFSNLFLKF